MLDELEEDVDTTGSRLKAAQKKIADVLRRSGTTTQLALIAFLVVVLIVVAVFAFM
jgi:SYP6 family syntaxin